ncbi:hypothetical protein [Haliea salexigens]|uniref:hypothetical protein n=1 Tax=Haliea salexigens TaxID=287487 RepID=UPI001184105E|nr:hypothetical protein [Haliea salexigens]
MKLAIQIAAGILIAAFVLIGIGMGFTYASLKAAEEHLEQLAQEQSAKTEARRQAQAAETESKRQAQLVLKENERRRKSEQRARAEIDRQRQIAFERQYDAPEGCENPSSERQFIECANDKIRARREFLEKTP